MRSYFLIWFALIIVCIICYIQIDCHCIWVYGSEATPLMYRGMNMTRLENLSFSCVYIITDNFSEHAYMTGVCSFVMTVICVYLRDSWCVSWLLFVILMHVCNFASVEVFNKALLTYLTVSREISRADRCLFGLFESSIATRRTRSTAAWLQLAGQPVLQILSIILSMFPTSKFPTLVGKFTQQPSCSILLWQIEIFFIRIASSCENFMILICTNF